MLLQSILTATGSLEQRYLNLPALLKHLVLGTAGPSLSPLDFGAILQDILDQKTRKRQKRLLLSGADKLK